MLSFEVETRTTIVTQACWMLAGNTKLISQHTLIASQHLPSHHLVLEPFRNWGHFSQSQIWGTHLWGKKVLSCLGRKAHHCCWGLLDASQHSHSILKHSMPSRCVRTSKQIGIVSAQAKFEGAACGDKTLSWGGSKANHCCPLPVFAVLEVWN